MCHFGEGGCGIEPKGPFSPRALLCFDCDCAAYHSSYVAYLDVPLALFNA